MMKQTESNLYRPCVGIVVVNESGKFLIAHRINKNHSEFQNAWQFPQGGIDKDEDSYKAALRELYEETSISSVKFLTEYPEKIRYDLPESLSSTLWKGKYAGQEQQWFMFLFVGHEEEINLQTKYPEFDQWMWSDPDQIIAKTVPFKHHVYEAVIPFFHGYWKKICGL